MSWASLQPTNVTLKALNAKTESLYGFNVIDWDISRDIFKGNVIGRHVFDPPASYCEENVIKESGSLEGKSVDEMALVFKNIFDKYVNSIPNVTPKSIHLRAFFCRYPGKEYVPNYWNQECYIPNLPFLFVVGDTRKG